MANVHSAIKQIRKDAKKRTRNQAVLSELKSLWRRFAVLPESESSQAATISRELIAKWDRAVSRGVVPKGRANRKKARIARHLTKLNPSR